MNKNRIILPYISATTTSLIFGLSYLFTKRALNLAEPFELLSFRFLTAFLIMSLFIILRIIKINYRYKPWKTLLLLGISQPMLYFIFETYGLKHSSSSQAGLMLALIPIFVSILGVYFLREIPSRKQLFFILLSVLGVIYIVLMNKSNSGSTSLIGTVMLIFAVLSSAAFNILSRKLRKDFSPFELTYFMMALGAICFNLISVLLHVKQNKLGNYFDVLYNKDFIISIVYLGIFSSILAFFLLNYTLSKIEASKSSVFANLSTIVSIIAGVVFLNESFKLYHAIGASMILLGVWGTSYFGYIKNKILDLDKAGSE